MGDVLYMTAINSETGAVEEVTLTLQLTPTGKARPRAVQRKGQRKAGVHNPVAYTRWKKDAAGQLRALLLMAKWPKATDPNRHLVRVSIHAFHVRPQNPPPWMKGKTPERVAERAAWREGWTPPRLATPDTDNMAGAVMDALNDTGQCWVDDAQAEIASVTSTWAAKGELAHIAVTLERVAWEVPTPLRENEVRT